MEEAHYKSYYMQCKVLILIIMEDTHGDYPIDRQKANA